MDIDYSVLKIRDSVDIYTSELDEEVAFVQFYFINTRRKIGIEIDKRFCIFLAKLDGKSVLSEVLNSSNIAPDKEALEVIQFLLRSNVLVLIEDLDEEYADQRYSRQITFLDDWVQGFKGADCQRRVSDAECVIFGIGAVGSNIAIQLVRAGVSKITLVDHKELCLSSQERHPYFSADRLGDSKVEVLKDHLLKINRKCVITVFAEKILPQSDLSKYISDTASIIINSADEPYIGHISIKLGRYVWPKKIPLYVAGGFDAHLMSTGDFLVPGESCCVDCCSDHFTAALKDWKPSYKVHERQTVDGRAMGGSGGLFPMAFFSANYAALLIINFLAGGTSYRNVLDKRGEFSASNAGITWTSIMKKEACHVCGE